MSPAVLDAPAKPRPHSAIFNAPKWEHVGVPAWFSELQHQAWQEFSSLPSPGRRDESWRFADFGQSNFDSFEDAGEVSASVVTQILARSKGLPTSLGRIIFINDRLVHLDDSLEQSGIVVQSLPTGLNAAKHHLNAISARLGSGKFLALHQAHLRNFLLITLPENLSLSAPVEIFHWSVGAQAANFPRTIIDAGECSRASIIQHHRSFDESPGLSVGATQIHAAAGAAVDYVICQQWNQQSKALHLSSTHCARDSKVKHCQVNLGASWSRTESVSHLEGAGSHSDMLSISLTGEEQQVDQRTLQLHHAPHAGSNLLYKNVLFGKSRNIFAGLIKVAEGAHFTDAYQTCRNLLMTDECESNAMPGLEINADQVKCSHGSTSGAIDPEEIFYFESRGIPEDAARELLAQGFLAQALERLSDEAVREFLVQQLTLRFESVTA